MEPLTRLIEAERVRLAEILGKPSIDVVEHGPGHSSVAIANLTVHFYRRPREELIDSSIELRSLPAHAVKLSDHLHTWLILKSRGEEWPEPVSAGSPSEMLTEELDRLVRALEAVGDDEMLLETLLWEAGYRDGYLQWG